MRNLYPIWFAALLVGGIALSSPQNGLTTSANDERNNPKIAENREMEEEEEGKIPKRDRMDLAWQFEVERTKDPATGRVPRERLAAAWEYTQSLTGQNDAVIAGVDWTERGPSNVSGRTRAIAIDPNDGTGNTVWAGSVGGGLWKTTNITANPPNWVAVDNFMGNLAVTGIAFDPSNSLVAYACTGEGYFNGDAIQGLGIWKTVNGGNTWTQLASTNNANFYWCQRIVVTSTGVVLVATSSGVRRSADGGTTWFKVLGTGLGITGATSNFAYDLEIAANGDIYGTLDGSVHKSINAGANWSAAQTLPIGVARVEIAAAPNDLNYAYALCENGGVVAGILRTTNGGTTWTSRTEPADADGGIPATDFSRSQAWYDLAIAVDPNNRDRLMVGGVDLFLSTDGAGTWSQIAHWYGGFGEQYVHADQHIIVYQPGSSTVAYYGNDGGVWRTGDANAANPVISFKGDNYNVTQYYACAMHPTALSNYFLAGAQDNGTQQYNSIGINATVEATGGDGAFCHIDQDQPQYQWTQYVYNDYYRSANGGATWTNATTGGGRFINPSDYDNVNNLMYACRGSNNYVRWDNPQTGATFTTVTAAPFAGTVSSVTVSPNTNHRVFFGIDNGDVFRVDAANTGAPTITSISAGLPNGYVNCVEVENGNDNHLLVTYSNYGVNSVWESLNGGTSWTSVEGNLPDMPIYWAIFNPNNTDQALIATELGVWSTDNLNGGGTVWGPSNTGLANVRVDMLQIRTSDKLVAAATHGRGLFTSDIFATPTALFAADKVVHYTAKNIQFTDYSLASTSWLYDFGDATSSTLANPVKAYPNPARYTCSLTINSGASNQTRNNYIHILPDRGTPYAPTDGGNFEVNVDDFDQVNYTGTAFVRGSSAVAGKNGTQSPTNAWVTALAGNYTDNSYSVLFCPNFNFTAAGVYTLRFYARYNCELNYDGFNVEYSLDKGDNWTVLGTAGAGWYNFANGAGGTAFPAGVPFFTGSNGAWTQYNRDVSFLAGNGNVAFRFVFRTDGGVTGPGVAIDDFQILAPVNGLPLGELLPLSANWEGNDARLRWATREEDGVRGFSVDRSFDGQQFENVSFVPAAVFSANGESYTFLDPSPGGDRLWYRIRMEKITGETVYSNAVLLHRGDGAAQNEFLLFPSPFRESFTLLWNEPVEGPVRMQIMDVNGAVVIDQMWEQLTGSSIAVTQLADALSAGLYTIRVQTRSGWQSKKALKF